MNDLIAEELKNINELRKEREKINGTNKIDWMYNEPNDKPNDEEYLLGKAIVDKKKNHVEHECVPPSVRRGAVPEEVQLDFQRKIQEDPLYAIKRREIEARKKMLENPMILKKLQTSKLVKPEESSDDELDQRIHAKLLKLRAMKQILSKKQKKKSNSSSSESDEYVEKKVKKRQNDFSDSDSEVQQKKTKINQKSDHPSTSSVKVGDNNHRSSRKWTPNKHNKKRSASKLSKNRRSRSHSKERKTEKYRKANKRASSRSSSNDSFASSHHGDNKRRNITSSKNSKTRNRSESPMAAKNKSVRHYSRSPTSNKKHRSTSPDINKSRSSGRYREKSPKFKNKITKYNSKSPDSKKDRKRKQDYKKESKEERSISPIPKNKGKTHRRSISPDSKNDRKRKQDYTKYSKEERSRSPIPKTKGKTHRRSISRDSEDYRSKTADSKTDLKHRNSPDSSKFIQNIKKSYKSKITDEERERKLKEMMENAEWRNELTKQDFNKKKVVEQDFDLYDEDPDFLRKQLLKSLSSSVEERTKSKRNTLQKGDSYMDKNFTRR